MNWRLFFTIGLLAVQAVWADPRMWKEDGFAVREVNALTGYTTEASRDDGAVLICWSSTRDGLRAIYGQLIAPDGIPQWGSDGMLLGMGTVAHADWPVATAVNGGWVVGWLDAATDDLEGYLGDPRAMKFNDSGARVWADQNRSGVLIDGHPAMVSEAALRVVHDGSGGAIFAWEDSRRGDPADIFAQRVTADGAIAWTEPVAVTFLAGEQYLETGVSDGSGNMILGWSDSRITNNRDIYGAKVTPEGLTPWGTNGVAVCTAIGRQLQPRACPDGSGGGVFVWRDARSGLSDDLYAQRVDESGAVQWQQNGIAVAVAPEPQEAPRICLSVNEGVADGAICVWQDSRVNGYVTEIFAQKFDLSGVIAWAENGLRICGDAGPDVTGSPRWAPRVVSDLSGGAVLLWEDQRDGYDWYGRDLFVARVAANGEAVWGSNCGTRIFPKDVNLQYSKIVESGENVLIVGSGQYGLLGAMLVQVVRISDGINLLEEALNLDNEIFGGDAGQQQVVTMSDSRLGIVWRDSRAEIRGSMLFYQILDVTADRQFVQAGIPLFPDGSGSGPAYWRQDYPRIVADGSGGFHAVYEDLRSDTRTIRYGHVNAAGELTTNPAGMVVTPPQTGYDQSLPRCAVNEESGCFVGWSEYTAEFLLETKVMRLDELGQPMWTHPITLARSESDNSIFDVVPSPEGSCIVAWKSGNFNEYEVSLARILGNGVADWNFDLCDLPGDRDDCVVLPDGEGGAYLAWTDLRDAERGEDIYAQHLDLNGIELWQENGMLICSALMDQRHPVIRLDEAANLIIVWEDFRNQSDLDLYAQRVSPAGFHTWPLEGLEVCVTNGDQYGAQVVTISADNIYVIWSDGREYPGDIYGVHLNAAGEVVGDDYWNENGSPVCAAQGSQYYPQVANDGAEGMVCVWEDWRGSSYKVPVISLYAQRIYDNPLGVDDSRTSVVTEFSLSQNFPNPFNATTEIRFSLPQSAHAELTVYDLTGRQVKKLVDRAFAGGEHVTTFDASQLASGIYFYRLSAGEFERTQKMVLLK